MIRNHTRREVDTVRPPGVLVAVQGKHSTSNERFIMRTGFFGLSTLSAILSATLVLLPGSSSAETPGKLPLRDEFQSKFTLDWETIRPDPTHLSLETHPGKLTITTQYGSMQSSQTTAKNLFFIDVPKGVDDFVVTTCVEGFLPETNWQQAGLLFYNDDDNFLKWVRDYTGRGYPILNIHWELDREADGIIAPVEVPKERFWLRVVKRGDQYQSCASLDGKEFTTYGIAVWSDGSPKKIGLVAKNGPREGDLEAQFDFFELRALTDAERSDPVYKVRRELLGTWTAVARRISGKPVTKKPVTTLTVTPGTFTLQDGKKLILSYTIDPTATPGRITFITRQYGVGQLLNGIYTLDDDTLTLCLNTKPNAPRPESLKTTEGDGRMLLEFKRTAD